MKKFLRLISVVAFIACNNDPKVESMSSGTDSTDTKSVADTVSYPYQITYYSRYEKGDPRQSKMILELWKAFDNGDMSVHKDYFADSVEMIFPDGTRLHNSKDSVIMMTNKFRSQYSSVVSRVDAVLPSKSLPDSVNWVSVWGMETHTKNGKTDSVDLQEVWRFNKNGKIDFMMQYDRKTPR